MELYKSLYLPHTVHNSEFQVHGRFQCERQTLSLLEDSIGERICDYACGHNIFKIICKMYKWYREK